MPAEDGELEGHLQDRSRDPSPDRKRSRDREEENGAAKRHKDHKHKKHKKHTRRDRDRGSSEERRSMSRSGSVSPVKQDRDRHRSSSRGRRERSRERRGRSYDRGNRSRDNRDRRDRDRDRSRGRGDRDHRDRSRDRSRGRDSRRSRGREERAREARASAYQREQREEDKQRRENPAEPVAKSPEDGIPDPAEPAPAPAPEPAPAPAPVEEDAEMESAEDDEEAEYRRRVEAQMEMMSDDESDEDDEEAAIAAARERRQAILAKHAAVKKEEEEKKQAELAANGAGAEESDQESNAGDLQKSGEDEASEDEDEDKMKAGDVDEMAMNDDRKKAYDMFDTTDEVVEKEQKVLDRVGGNVLDVDNWDDADGYYKFQMGELMNKRYEVHEVLGKGVFSNVLNATDKGTTKENTKVAIKIIRNNEMMKKCGDKELMILQLLAKDSGADKHNIVQLNEHFFQHGHLCLVFEALSMNLREVIRKFGHNRGINIGAVHKFSKQMFVALKHLKHCKVVHADIKPDNILVNDKHNQIKICDFGSASFIQECEITPYLVSRWYRAPEITLCLKYDYGIDMWSIATCLYELYTGKVMFPGSTNNDMIRRFQEIKGKFPNKLLKRSIIKQVEIGRPVDFTDDFKFLRVLQDKVTKKESIKIVTVGEKPEKDLLKLLMPRKLTNPDEEVMVRHLCDLLHNTLMLNSEHRYVPEQALKHPFVKTHIQP